MNNSKMILYPKKGAIHFDLFLYKKREPICTEYLLNSGILKEGDVALDIGANIGYYALTESRIVGEKGKVYAVEPVQENFDLLKKNVTLNSLKNVGSFRFAFGGSTKRGKIYVSESVNLCAMDKDSVGGVIVGEEDVQVETVDSFLKDKQYPQLIRMDVEGYEYEIFKGMPKTLKGDVRILIELHPRILREKLDALFQILEQNNFRVRFAVFENKVRYNWALMSLMRKGGEKMPLTYENISLQQLRKLMDENIELDPNVIFEKTPATPD
ncbi:MAG: FkbM family methyltransferase [Candidatus Bathyarchaeota archaeon]|nr:FkbM family methyltransferase [Candidatus Bathyarchaeota archaeon]